MVVYCYSTGADKMEQNSALTQNSVWHNICPPHVVFKGDSSLWKMEYRVSFSVFLAIRHFVREKNTSKSVRIEWNELIVSNVANRVFQIPPRYIFGQGLSMKSA
jgi:hypothetical protein